MEPDLQKLLEQQRADLARYQQAYLELSRNLWAHEGAIQRCQNTIECIEKLLAPAPDNAVKRSGKQKKRQPIAPNVAK